MDVLGRALDLQVELRPRRAVVLALQRSELVVAVDGQESGGGEREHHRHEGKRDDDTASSAVGSYGTRRRCLLCPRHDLGPIGEVRGDLRVVSGG